MHRFYAVFTVESLARLIRQLRLEDTPYADQIESNYRQYGGLFVFNLAVHDQRPRIAMRLWKANADIVYELVDDKMMVVKDRVVSDKVQAQLDAVLADFANIPQLTINTSGYPEELRAVEGASKERSYVTGLISHAEASWGIRVVAVIEIGSQPAGYASPQSDIDVMLVYVQLPWKLEVNETRDSLAFGYSHGHEQVEVQGVELRRCVQLLTRSDPHMTVALHGDVLAISEEAKVLLPEVMKHYMNISALRDSMYAMAKANIMRPLRKTEMYGKDIIYGFMAALRYEHMHNTGKFVTRIDEFDSAFGKAEDIRDAIQTLRELNAVSFDQFDDMPIGFRLIAFFNNLPTRGLKTRAQRIQEGEQERVARVRDMAFANERYAKICAPVFYGL